MTARIMLSHTREIVALTVPFFTVVIVVSLMTAGAIDNTTLEVTDLPQEQPSQILILEPSSTPPAFANSVEVATPTLTPTTQPTPEATNSAKIDTIDTNSHE